MMSIINSSYQVNLKPTMHPPSHSRPENSPIPFLPPSSHYQILPVQTLPDITSTVQWKEDNERSAAAEWWLSPRSSKWSRKSPHVRWRWSMWWKMEYLWYSLHRAFQVRFSWSKSFHMSDGDGMCVCSVQNRRCGVIQVDPIKLFSFPKEKYKIYIT